MVKLKESHIVRYSPTERHIFSCLLENPGHAISTEAITKYVYKKFRRPVPKSGRIVVAGAVRKLIEKTQKNSEPFKITKTYGAGPYSTEVKIEVRNVE